MLDIASKTLHELRNLSITKVQWCCYLTLGFTQSDGQNCQAGTKYAYDQSHTFDPAKKITKIIVTIDHCETMIYQINFYHYKQRLLTLGYEDDWVKKYGGRTEVFEIEDDERWIGCKLDQSKRHFIGITWIKMKVFRI